MSQDLKRTLSLWDAISVVSGSMIGCGIFIVSADISRQVQSGFLMILVWILAGFITMCGALSFAELAANITEEGGQYIYLKKIYSEKIAFLYGWTTFLVIQTGTIAAVCVAFAKFLGILIPFISTNNYLFQYGVLKLSTQQICALATVIFLTYINSKGIKHGVITQNLFTVMGKIYFLRQKGLLRKSVQNVLIAKLRRKEKLPVPDVISEKITF